MVIRSLPDRREPSPAARPVPSRARATARACAAAAAIAAASHAGPARPEAAGLAPAPLYLRGLVELSRPGDFPLRPLTGPEGADEAPARATLLSAPGVGTVIDEVDADALASVPSGPGTVGALVFDVAGPEDAHRWYLLARSDDDGGVRYGWYRPAPGERLRAYERLLIDGLAFMRNGWDGRLYATPLDPVAHRVIPPSGGGAIRVVDAWMDPDAPGESWLLIVVFVEDSVCGEDWPVVVASGWVRAYRDDAGPAAWFHAEGC